MKNVPKVILSFAIILNLTGCGGPSPEEAAKLAAVAAPGTQRSRGDFFEFPGGCVAMNLSTYEFDGGLTQLVLYPESGVTGFTGANLVEYGARLLPKERNEEALHRWVRQSHDTHDCFFKEAQ